MNKQKTNFKSDKKNDKKEPISTSINIPNKDLFENINSFIEKYISIFFWIGLILTLLFSFFLFDFKVSDGGDDSAYIVRAYDFIHKGIYPSFQGPLYPIILSLFILVFGIKVTLLKFLSYLFLAGQFVFLYKAFKNRIPASLLISMLLIISVSSTLLYFASQTYNEAFFMLVQAVFIFFVMKYIIDLWDKTAILKNDWKKYLIIGLFLFLLFLSKNIGLGALIAFTLYLLIFGKWKKLIYSLGGFFAFFIPLEIIKRIVWSDQMIQIASQGKSLLLKDFYSPVKGNEDFTGFIQRFIDNSHLFLSKHLFIFMGLKSNAISPTNQLPQVNHFLTYLVYLIGIIALIFVFKKSKALFFAILYTGTICVITFFAIQTMWDQPRIIIIMYPFLLLTLLTGIYYLLKIKSLKKLQFVFFFIVGIIFVMSFKDITNKIAARSKVFTANLSGNLYYGMTPDWVNFIEMSKYVDKNIHKDSMVASRKPEIGFVYTGRDFYGIYNIPSIPLDTFLRTIKTTPDKKAVCINIAQINNSPAVQIVHNQLINYTHAFINANLLDANKNLKENRVVGVYIVPANFADSIIPNAKKNGVEFIDDVEALLRKVDKENWSYAIQNPEAMLQTLKDSKVKYFILASLRKIPQQNTGEVISTLHRYLYFIQLKYPNIATQIHSIGNTEPSALIKLNY